MEKRVLPSSFVLYAMPIMKSKSKIVAATLTLDIAIRFMSENSGFSVPTITVHKPASQTYEIRNIAEVIAMNVAVADSKVANTA